MSTLHDPSERLNGLGHLWMPLPYLFFNFISLLGSIIVVCNIYASKVANPFPTTIPFS